jgi:ankyrin repeat protein
MKKAKTSSNSLIQAIYNQDEQAVSNALRGGTDVDSCDERGVPALVLAAKSFGAAVPLLLGAGAAVNQPRKNGDTALHLAAGDPHLVRLLLQAGADPNCQNKRGWAPVTVAAARNRDALEAMLVYGGNVNALRPNNQHSVTPLMAAIAAGNLATEALLRNQGPRTIEVAGGTFEVEGLHVHLTTKDGTTALSLAARLGRVNSCWHLLAAGGNVNQQDRAGMTPVMLAATANHTDTLEALIMGGHADLSLRNGAGADAFKCCAKGSTAQLHVGAQLNKQGLQACLPQASGAAKAKRRL